MSQQRSDKQSSYQEVYEVEAVPIPEADERGRRGDSYPPPNASSFVRGPSPEEFERLCRSIDGVVSRISRLVGKSIADAGGNIGEAIGQAVQKGQEGFNRSVSGSNQMPPPDPATLVRHGRSSFRSTTGLSASGALMAIGGGMGVLAFGGSAATLWMMPGLSTSVIAAAGSSPVAISAVSAAEGGPAAIFMAVLAAVFAGVMVAGFRRLSLSRHLRAFKRAFGRREVCEFDELAPQTGMSRSKTVKEARKMLAKGLIPQGHIDDDETCLMVTDDSYRLYRQARDAYLSRQAERSRISENARERAESLPADAAAFLRKGRKYVDEMRRLDAAIDDPLVSDKIVSIEEVVGCILDRIQDDPSLAESLSKLMDYYLPTTVKLLVAYDDLEEQPVQGDNIARSRQEIERTLTVLHNAYEKLLDETYHDFSLDVSADITVLNAVLAQEGLTDGPFDTPSGDSASRP